MTAISEAAPDADQEEAACAIGATADGSEAEGRQIMTRPKENTRTDLGKHVLDQAANQCESPLVFCAFSRSRLKPLK
jgi:hypothetical protein